MGPRLKASVAICVFNEEEYVAKCIEELLGQTFRDFELIVVDDHSTDNTADLVRSFKDEKIKYFRNEKQLGLTKSRNVSLSLCDGEYVFFTDGDCTVAKDWIEQGIKTLEANRCAAVEGRICYVSNDYEPTFSDHVMKNEAPGNFMTGNIAYRRDILERVGGFDEKYIYLSDRNLGLKVLRAGGRTCYNPNMIVYHPRVTMSIRQFVRSENHLKDRVHLFKEFRDRERTIWRIVYPRDLVAIVFPPAILLSPLINRYRKWEDFRLLPFIYVRAIYGRFCLWLECIRERVFLI
jgi:glycosyltransferase involved in cell wall biosynthesis